MYLPSRSAGLVYEDAQWRDQPISHAIPGRGLSMLTLRWTPDVSQAHAGNLLIHLVNGLLVYAVALPLTSPPIALAATAIALLHPLTTTAVNYLTARSDLLVTCFLLLTVLAVLHQSWFGAVVACLGAMASKEVGVIAMPIALITALVYQPQFSKAWSVVVIAASAWLTPIAMAWMTMRGGYGGSLLPYGQFLAVQSRAIGRLLALLIIPVGFTIDHDPVALSAGWTVLAIAAVSALIVGAWASKLGLWTLGCVGCVILPRLLVSSTEYMQEWHAYPVVILGSLALASALASVTKESYVRSV